MLTGFLRHALSSGLIALISTASAATMGIAALRFDHPGSSALPLRQSYNVDLDKPEWVRGLRSHPALYVKGDANVQIRAWIEAPPEVEQALVWAELLPGGGGPALGLAIDSTWVEFNEGVAEGVPCQAARPLPNRMGVFDFQLQWMARDGRGGPELLLNRSGPHRFYTLLDSPGAPWSTIPGDHENPWSSALDLALRGDLLQVSNAVEAQHLVTQTLFDHSIFEYDIWSGASEYTSSGDYENWRVDFDSMIDDIRRQIVRVGNCYDGAAAVVTFSNLLGCRLKFLGSGGNDFWGFTAHTFGYLNCIDPIGRGPDYSNNPFSASSYTRNDAIVHQDGTAQSCDRSAFGNHAFAGTQGGPNARIWDATMCIDVDDNGDTSVLFPAPDGDARSSALQATALVDADQSWIPDEFVGMLLNPNSNHTTPDPYLEYEIVGNSATTIYTTGGDLRSQASVGDHYWVRDPAHPQVDINHLVGVPWSLYRPAVVDDNPASNTDDPVECTLTLSSPGLSTRGLPPMLLAAYGAADWHQGHSLVRSPARLSADDLAWLAGARFHERVLVLDEEPFTQYSAFLRAADHTLRLTLITTATAPAAHRYLSHRLCRPRAMSPLALPALPFGETRLSALGDVGFGVGDEQAGRILFVRANVVASIEAEGELPAPLENLAREVDRQLQHRMQ